jgi:cell division protein FtsQ
MIKKNNPRYNKRKKSIKQFLLPIAKALPFFAMLAFIVWRVLESDPTEFLKAQVSWEIDGSLPIDQAILEDKIQPLIQDKYQLNLHEIKQVLETEPWVDTAHVERLFWNSIQIDIEPQDIAMRWENINCSSKNKTNCVGYISTTGELFIPKTMIPSNAVLARSEANQAKIIKLYTDYQDYQILSGDMVITTFSRTNIDQLTFNPNIKVILGYQQQEQRLERFIKAYAKIKPSKKVRQVTFDMRYPKGFSLSY